MNSKILLLPLFLFFTCSMLFSQAGDDLLEEIQETSQKEADSVWVIGGGFGIDFAQLALFNPRPGSGSNRIGFGGLGSFFVKYKKGKFYWDNNISLQESVQRLGKSDEPFRKSLDVLRLGSRAGSKVISAKVALAADFTFETVLFKDFGEGLLEDTSEAGDQLPITKFLSPYRLAFAPGVDYKPNEHFSLFFSPASVRITGVADTEGVRDVTLLGVEEGESIFFQFGGTVKAAYNNKYFNDKFTVGTMLDLFSNYLENPDKVDVLWQNNIGWNLTKSISVNIVTELFYDYDVKDEDGGPHGTSFSEALLIKYNYIF